ncbi:unnamed protein product, partial [marine sediment metagenome]
MVRGCSLILNAIMQASHAGTITVYEDSQPGTLNDFLGAMT